MTPAHYANMLSKHYISQAMVNYFEITHINNEDAFRLLDEIINLPQGQFVIHNHKSFPPTGLIL